ncbi:MAG: hypothetical protein JJT95_19040 [Pararhodobacter sp.]|nr:hypothetical protein [Pararhodobacter sp.]
MTTVTSEEIELVLDELESLFSEDPNIISIGVERGEDGENSRVIISVLALENSSFPKERQFQLSSRSISLPIVTQVSPPIVMECATDDEVNDSFGAVIRSDFAGMGGTWIGREGSWGTVCLSSDNIDISIDRPGQALERCAREGPTIFSNAHVLAPNGTNLFSFSSAIGVTRCHFDLNKRQAADYGHASWDAQFNSRNYFRVFDSSNSAGKRIATVGTVREGLSVGKQGARTGWSEGTVLSRAMIRVQGYSGTFRCWKANYHSMSGDSGSAIIRRSGASWEWVGMHFASGPHFWSWDTIGGRVSIQIELANSE